MEPRWFLVTYFWVKMFALSGLHARFRQSFFQQKLAFSPVNFLQKICVFAIQ
jgi:hypothetical protein